MNKIYFYDNQRRAAEHILDSPFGARLAQLDAVERNEAQGWLSVDLDAGNWLSSGERVLLDVLGSLADGDGTVDLSEFWRLDDPSWDRIIAALFMARGRILAVSS